MNRLLRRSLSLYEHQAKTVLRQSSVPIQRFILVSDKSTLRNDIEVFSKDGLSHGVVVKAQIMAGGRGKGRFSDSASKLLNPYIKHGGVVVIPPGPSLNDEAVDYASNMLGRYLHTAQTASDGEIVSEVMIAEAKDLKQEGYLAFLLDRRSQGVIMLASGHGGMDIEGQDNDAIRTFSINHISGPTENQITEASKIIKFESIANFGEVVRNLYRAFLENQATLLEINPLGITPSNELICFDAKIEIDDNAHFPESKTVPFHMESISFNEVDLSTENDNANIGCIANGAGLAMATMDILALHGGKPVNFLDTGGNTSSVAIQEALSRLLNHPKVKCIFVNIFGGIVRCDVVAQGIVNALRRHSSKKHVVVRLEGTNCEMAHDILQNSASTLHVINGMEQGAIDAVRLAGAFEFGDELLVPLVA